jgi:hypothetical protein
MTDAQIEAKEKREDAAMDAALAELEALRRMLL